MVEIDHPYHGLWSNCQGDDFIALSFEIGAPDLSILARYANEKQGLELRVVIPFKGSVRSRPSSVRCFKRFLGRTRASNLKMVSLPNYAASNKFSEPALLPITTIPFSVTVKPRRRSSSWSKPISIPDGIVTPLSIIARRIRA